MDNKRPSDRLRELQKKLTRAAAEVMGEQMEENIGTGEETDKYNRREGKELNRREQQRERSRHELFKWSRHLYHARRYTGGKGNPGGFWRRREIRQDYILYRIAGNERRRGGRGS
eukprot:4884016-Pleurochrysis_carterae.AAC.5